VILLLDNYDSFTYNLAHLLAGDGAEVRVIRNDAITADEAEALQPSHLVISPGPGRPATAGNMPAILERLAPRVPTLGVCLGHQAIVEAFGGRIGHAQRLVHGKDSVIRHDGRGVFRDLPGEITGGRYHSLAATYVNGQLDVTATAEDGEVMGVRHKELSIEGLQFHPESVLTPLGPQLIQNFLERRDR